MISLSKHTHTHTCARTHAHTLPLSQTYTHTHTHTSTVSLPLCLLLSLFPASPLTSESCHRSTEYPWQRQDGLQQPCPRRDHGWPRWPEQLLSWRAVPRCGAPLPTVPHAGIPLHWPASHAMSAGQSNTASIGNSKTQISKYISFLFQALKSGQTRTGYCRQFSTEAKKCWQSIKRSKTEGCVFPLFHKDFFS